MTIAAAIIGRHDNFGVVDQRPRAIRHLGPRHRQQFMGGAMRPRLHSPVDGCRVPVMHGTQVPALAVSAFAEFSVFSFQCSVEIHEDGQCGGCSSPRN